MKKFLLYVAIILLLTAGMAAAADESWIEFGGDYQLRYDNLKATVPGHTEYFTNIAVPGHQLWNAALFTNRLGINMRANPIEDITFKVRLEMYKMWGNETSRAISVPRAFGAPGMLAPVMDQGAGKWPESSEVWLDYGYATWSNVGGAPFWLSIGRRPSTHGAPGNIRENLEKSGTAGVPGNLIDAAFDGFTIGWAPEIEALPGFYTKYCGGKGMNRGFGNASNIPRDTNFGGLMTSIVDTPELHIEQLFMKAWHLMSAPGDGMRVLDHVWESTKDVGDMQWWGLTVMGKPMDNLNLFGTVAQNFFYPSLQVRPDFKFGMLWQGDFPEQRKRHTGTGYWVGGRYDFKSTGTKVGLEYNWGSKYWFPFTASSNDILVNKVATRGYVWEGYVIQELDDKPIAKRGKAFFRVGYQYYKFKYTGSMNWLERPIAMSDLTLSDTAGQGEQWLVPIKDAKDIYVIFDVLF